MYCNESVIPVILYNHDTEFLDHVVPLSATTLLNGEWLPMEQYTNFQRETQHCHDSLYMAIAENGMIVDAMLSCNPDRQHILVQVVEQLGVDWLASQSDFLNALMEEEWLRAARYLLDSVWAEQDSSRAWQYATVLVRGTQRAESNIKYNGLEFFCDLKDH